VLAWSIPNLFFLRESLQTFSTISTACVTCVWAGVDSAWEQEKLEARKMLENAAESPASSARFVSRRN
jgi:hypothetical protein